jgi:hypothetical protein
VDSFRYDSGELKKNTRGSGKVEIYKGGTFKDEQDPTSYNYDGIYIGNYNEPLNNENDIYWEVAVDLDQSSNPRQCSVKGKDSEEKPISIEDCESIVDELGI